MRLNGAFGRKPKLGKLENERNRARMLQGMELSGAEGGVFRVPSTVPLLELAHPLCLMTRMKHVRVLLDVSSQVEGKRLVER